MAGSGTAHLRADQERALSVENLVVEFPVTGGTVHAVSDLSIDLIPGETLGILGESGCGKSSAGRALMQLPAPTSGRVVLGDTDLTTLKKNDMRRARAKMQMIMQDPVSALNPRRKVKDLVAEGLEIWGFEGDDKAKFVDELLASVGLDPEVVRDRRPHEMSGGQCQRVCIARSLALDPDVLICDEPVSSLDVSVQAQVLNLLEVTRERYSLSMIFIAHDVAVVKNISDRVLVMYLGKTCEVIPTDDMQHTALHPYTRLLLESVPRADDAQKAAQKALDHGPTKAVELPSPLNPPSGCRFRTRCPLATDRCAAEEPELREMRPGQFVACHNVAP
ncbi:ABC transporter ATP-binding protein [Nocardioides alcanivorans]|uniref:ABC transporter ATP-binding protein n=1 Tax=Nocardioides alcanivorans TaxID=2897352 RepID=UPI001F42B1C7|nr:oligopeptide/dipeptide ABC transporter ATP-binding protein [Nocardioides alcanivorans]